jgi:hypothetical protein
MRYLGSLRGSGVLKSGDDATGVQANYDFDGFLRKNDQVASCGEIRMAPGALKDVFGRRDLRLLTEDGRVLNLCFSDKQLKATSDAAPVDVTGELPDASGWCR